MSLGALWNLFKSCSRIFKSWGYGGSHFLLRNIKSMFIFLILLFKIGIFIDYLIPAQVTRWSAGNRHGQQCCKSQWHGPARRQEDAAQPDWAYQSNQCVPLNPSSNHHISAKYNFCHSKSVKTSRLIQVLVQCKFRLFDIYSDLLS